MDDASDYFGEDMATFGDRVAAAREAAGLSQGQLARRLGVKAQTVEGWEADRSEPRANRLQMMAGILNVSIMWLMTGEGAGVEYEPEAVTGDQDLINELRQLRMDQRQLSERMARLEKKLRLRLQ